MPDTQKVSMNLTEEEIALVERLRPALGMVTKTGTVVQALRIVGLIAENLEKGKIAVFIDRTGRVESRLAIPGLSG